jgi:hypothetical protein
VGLHQHSGVTKLLRVAGLGGRRGVSRCQPRNPSRQPPSGTTGGQAATDQATALGESSAAAASPGIQQLDNATPRGSSNGSPVGIQGPANSSANGAAHGMAGRAPAPHQSPVLDPSAYDVAWDFVTIRGCSDGQTIVYKFGVADPTPRLMPVSCLLCLRTGRDA